MNKTDSFIWDLSYWSNAISNVAMLRQYITEQYDMRIARQYLSPWSNAISNVAMSRQYITEQYDMRIAWWYIAIDKLDFCSQLINFMQFGKLFKVVAIVSVAKLLRFVKKFIEKIFRIGKFQKCLSPLTMRHRFLKISSQSYNFCHFFTIFEAN